MSAVERNILTVIEPSIELDELEMADVESGTENSDGVTMKEKPSKFSTMIPLIRVNSYEVQGDRLEMFQLNCTGFYPTCRFSFLIEMECLLQDFSQRMGILFNCILDHKVMKLHLSR